MANGKLKKYLVSGEVRASFSIKVDAESVEAAEEQVDDMGGYELMDRSDIEDLEIYGVDCLDEDDDDN